MKFRFHTDLVFKGPGEGRGRGGFDGRLPGGEGSEGQADRNSLAFWFPKIEAAGLKVPRTKIVTTNADLLDLLDGKLPLGYGDFMHALVGACEHIGWPVFLRTGHGSGKHEWSRTCYVERPEALPSHVGALVEWSALVDVLGLPTNVWAVREMIPTAPLFTCAGYKGFPVTREFRFFVRDGEVEHAQPYWPADAVEQGRPDDPNWREALAWASDLAPSVRHHLAHIAAHAGRAVGGGYWSVDLLEDRDGEWWLTDMAEGDRSFRWEPEAGPSLGSLAPEASPNPRRSS